MEEENQQLEQIVSDVVVGLLQAQDARREERFVFVQSHLIDTVPGEESKLEEVFNHHHHLQRSRAQRESGQ